MQAPKKVEKIHVKKDDLVIVISGKDKGKKGKVLSAMPKQGKVIVEGVNIATKHKKPRAMGQPGGIMAALPACAVSFVVIVIATWLTPADANKDADPEVMENLFGKETA